MLVGALRASLRCARRLRAPGAAAGAAPAPVAQRAAPPKRSRADEMKVSGTLGTLNDDEIAGPFQRRWDDITRCYDEAAQQAAVPRRQDRAEAARGARRGEPKSAFVVGVDVRQLRRRALRARHRARAALRAAARRQPRRSSATRSSSAPGGRCRPGTRRACRRRWRATAQDVHECKAKAPGGLPPPLSMTVYVAPGGKVASAGLAADAPLDDAFAACLVGKTQGVAARRSARHDRQGHRRGRASDCMRLSMLRADEQRLVRDTAREFAERELAPARRRAIARATFPSRSCARWPSSACSA